MKKFIAVILSICIISGYATAIYAYESLQAPEYNYTEQTPTGGLLVPQGETTELSEPPVQFFSSLYAAAPLEEYLREQILNHEETIVISTYNIPESEFSDTLFSFVFRNSDLPVRAGYRNKAIFTSDGEKYVYSFTPYYLYNTKEESDLMRGKLLSLTENLKNHANAGADELEKTLFLFDKISLDFDYSTASNASDSEQEGYVAKYEDVEYSPYGFIREDNKTAVCQGFAGLYNLVLNMMGIENIPCANYDKAVNHIWNYVKIDDNWYHSDVTWSYYLDASNKINHKYFLLSDDTMVSDGLHGAKADWDIQTKDYDGVTCSSKNHESGHLFNHFSEPLYRDSKSLYFTFYAYLINGDSTLYPITFRSNSLKANKGIFSDVTTAGERKMICLYTLQANSDTTTLLIGAYNGEGRYQGCYTIPINPYDANVILTLGIPGAATAIKKLKYMHLLNDFITPLANYSEILVNQ